MVKTKEPKWTEQKVLYKDGDPDVFRKFGWQTWRRMTDDERAMWTELSMDAPAPISKEVIEFNEKVEDDLNDQAEEALAPKATLKLSEIETVREALKEKGIKFAYNSKLPTLLKKLENADNPE